MIIAIDPGQTTGIAVATNYQSDTNFTLASCGEIDWSKRFWFYPFFQKNHLSIQAIIIEDFKLFKHKMADQVNSRFPSSQVIGIIEAYAHLFDLSSKIVYQYPYQIKRTDPVTKKSGYSVKALAEHSEQLRGSKHSKEAYLHLRFFLKTLRRN